MSAAPALTGASLEIRGLAVGYARAQAAVENLDLSVAGGELVSLLGPSGCGKTTTMRAIAGLLRPRAGTVRIGGRDVTNIPPNHRDVGLVFQSYALFPHLTVFENVAFGLRVRRTPRADLERRVHEALEVVGLKGFESRVPAQLSGGQQQRVALARAFVVRPQLLLLDEPLSNLDARLRVEMRVELRRLQRELGLTMLYVTHDQAEALALSDRMIVMRAGRIEQQGPPEAVYARPATPFVANFLGFDNILDARVDGSRLRVSGAGGSVDLVTPPGASADGVTRAAWRPEAVRLGDGPLQGRVLARTFGGETVEYLLESPVGHIKALAPAHAAPWVENDAVAFTLPPERAALMGEA